MSYKIRIMLKCYLRTSNSLSLGVWWVSNILTHISHFPYWIVVISSSFMCFNKFLECIDDLLRSTKIEARKHENKAFLKEGETPQQNKRRSFAKSGRSTAQNNKNWSSAERSPVVRQNPAERSPGLKITKKTPRGERSPNWGDRPPSWAVVLLIWANVSPANFQHRFFMSRTFAKLRRTTAKLRWYKNDDVLTSFQEGKLGQITWAINISCFRRKISILRERESEGFASLSRTGRTRRTRRTLLNRHREEFLLLLYCSFSTMNSMIAVIVFLFIMC